MCIILYKPAGTPMPERETLLNCFHNNPDGAGYMFVSPKDGRVHVRKGYMAFSSLCDSLDSMGDVTDLPMVLHFRITTQGNTDAKNTHPFPVTSDHDALVSRHSIADVAVAHNGIISLTTSYSKYNTNNREQFSDTYYFVRDYMSLIVDQNPYWYQQKSNVKLASKLADSKLCVLSSDGHVVLIGAFEKGSDGCFYSNSTYKYSIRGYHYTGGGYGSYSGYGYCSTWDYDDEDDWTYMSKETERGNMARFYGFRNEGELDAFLSVDSGTTKNTEIEDEEAVTVKILASFIPTEGVLIHNENSGEMIDPNTDTYLHDLSGRVFWYDEKDNVMFLMDDHFTIDSETFERVVMDKQTGCLFEAVL